MVGLLRVSRRIVGMTVNEILAQLESLGDDARRAHNTKACAPDNQFGVKLGDVRAMAKKIKTDHELALNLWDTGNVEAQLLATLIIKPKSLSALELDELTRSTTCAQVAEWLNSYVVAQHPETEALREKWMKAKDRWAARPVAVIGDSVSEYGLGEGHAVGRRPKLGEKQRAVAVDLYRQKKHKIDDICKAVGITRPTLYKYVAAAGGSRARRV